MSGSSYITVSYTHLRAHETDSYLVCRLLLEKKRVNLFATLKAKSSQTKKPIILSGHTDVVPVSKGWSSDPFTATIKGDKLYGRGSCDMKGFIACALAHAPTFSKSNLDRDIHFSFTFDEETACQGAPILLSLIHISEPTRRTPISYAVFCLKKKE